MRIDNYARVQDFARQQDDLNGLPDEMSQARHPRTTWALRKDSVDVPACVNGKKGEAFAGEAKEVYGCVRKITTFLNGNCWCLR